MRALMLATTVVLALAGPARADTFDVTGFGDSGGQCAGTACPSIRAALGAAKLAPGPDTIALPKGTYSVTAAALQVDSDVTITGNRADDTTVQAQSGDRVFFVATGVSATIAHLTMTGGVADGTNNFFGGDLTNYGTLLLDHVRVTGGSGSSAGGVANRGGTLTIQSSLIDHNTALTGGGDAGAILNFGGDGPPAALVVRDTTVAFNQARLIGGISEYGNTADTTTLERVTVAYNHAGDRAGAALQSANGIHVRSSLVAANTTSSGRPNCDASVIDDGFNVEDGTDCGFQVADSSVRMSDALGYDGGETDVLALLDGSPAIDAGGDCNGSDQRDLRRPQGVECDAGAYEAFSGVGLVSGPPSVTNQRSVRFEFGSDDSTASYECRLDVPGGDGTYAACSSGQSYTLDDGSYRFVVRALHQGTQTGAPLAVSFRIDTVAPEAPAIGSAAGGVLSGTAEPLATVQILDGGVIVASTTAGQDGRWSVAVPTSGQHTYAARAVDAGGNASPLSAPVTVGASPAHLTPTPAPSATPTPSPTPTPVPGKTVVAAPVSGKVLVKKPGAKGYVAVDVAQGIPLGSTVDTTHGTVRITAKAGQTAIFYDGIFKVTQTKTTTDLTLNQPLAPCGSKARAAAKKPKSRKLWGSGSGSFRTRGQYSSATVRGTTWLVQDSCSGTLTRVTSGVVSVRDQVRRRTILLKAGKSYTARPRRR